MQKKFSETDLYEPVKTFFTDMGYTVRGEVKGCDLTAVKADELVVVELKLSFNITLLFQALNRQKMTPLTYVAIPRPKKANAQYFNDTKHVLSCLGLGLITVALDSPIKTVEFVLYPAHTGEIKHKKARRSVISEASARSSDGNIGGSKGVKLLTAYRERCIKLACILDAVGPSAAHKLVKDFDCGKDTHSILYTNHYGWFARASKGIYCLSGEGDRFLEENAGSEIVIYYKEYFKNLIKDL